MNANCFFSVVVVVVVADTTAVIGITDIVGIVDAAGIAVVRFARRIGEDMMTYCRETSVD